MANNEQNTDDPLANFGQPEASPDQPINEPEVQKEPVSAFESNGSASFSTLSQEEADISEYQEEDAVEEVVEKKVSNLSIEDRVVRAHALSKIALGIVIALCVLVVADGFIKASSEGSPLLKLPFFQQGNILCNRINGGVDLSSMTADTDFLIAAGEQDLADAILAGDCIARNDLLSVYEKRETYLKKQVGTALAEVLPKVFSFNSFAQSPLFRFIQTNAPDRRIQHAKLIEDVLEIVESIDSKQNMHLFCQRILFEERIANLSCLAQGRADVTSRDVAIAFFDAIKRNQSFLIVDHPDAIELRQLDDEDNGYDTETVVDLRLIQTSSGFELDIIPQLDN